MRSWGVLVLIALLVYGAITLIQLDLPGLYYDEALDVVPTMQLLRGQPVILERGVGVWVGSTAFPVMIMDYVGAVNTYLMLPFFWLFGVNVYSLRLMTLLAGAVTLVLGFRVGSRLFGTAPAALATLLLAVHPSFVFWSRMGITVTSVMTVFSLGSLLSLFRWWDRRDRRFLILACWLMGLGLWAKLLFLWWIVALAGAGLALLLLGQSGGPGQRLRSGLRAVRQAAGVHGLLGGAVAFVLGAAPLIWYNVVSGATVETLGRNLVTTDYGVNNLDIARNMAAAWETFGILLNGSYFWYQGGPFANDLYLPVFLACAAGAVAMAAVRIRTDRKPLLGVALVIALILAQSSVTVSGHWATHLYILYPLPQLVMGLFAVRVAGLWRVLPARVLGLSLAVAAVALPVVGDVYVDYQYQATMNDTRGVASASNAIYRLADYLDTNRIVRPKAVDWGFSKNIQILTEGRVNPEEIYGFGRQAGDVFVGEVRKHLANPANLYLFHSEQSTVYPRLEVFLREAGALGKKVNVEQVFYQQDGVVVYLLVSAR